MAARKRPAAALPPVGDVREHADLVRDIMDEHPDWGYKRIGARLGEVLGVTLTPLDYQAVLRLQKAEPAAPDEREAYEDFAGDVREHVDAIRELMGGHPDMGYRRIGRELEKQLRVKLSEDHLQVIRSIMTEIAEDRVAVGVPMREHPEREDFAGDVREHVDAIKELMRRHPDISYARIGRELEDELRVKLSRAHLSVIRRIMIRHGDALSYEFLSGADEVDVVQGLFERYSGLAARRRAVQEHYCRDVAPAVLRRLASQNYVSDRGDYPVRRVWQDGGDPKRML